MDALQLASTRGSLPTCPLSSSNWKWHVRSPSRAFLHPYIPYNVSGLYGMYSCMLGPYQVKAGVSKKLPLLSGNPNSTEMETENGVKRSDFFSRRSLFAGALSVIAFVPPFVLSESSCWTAGAATTQKDELLDRLEELVEAATSSWEKGQDPSNPDRLKSLYEACDFFDKIVEIEPERSEWLEARGQVEVDAKRFKEALTDFTEALRRNPENYRAYASRALAFEGLSLWDNAIQDYTKALSLGQKITGTGPEPYVMNSRGNAYASVGRYELALKDYEESRKGFQAAKALDGAIYAASNAALTRIQLGQEEEGVRGLAAVARRAPASIDMRAALAAVYWAQGNEEKAEEEWNFACQNINTGKVFDGCARYRDQDWLRRIRRWPPIMAQRMDDFFTLKTRQ